MSEFHETWREGSAFRSLKKKKDAIAQEKVAIEEQKKRMKKSKGAPISLLCPRSWSMWVLIGACGRAPLRVMSAAKTTSPNRDNEADKEKDAESEETSHQEEIFRLRLQGLKKVRCKLRSGWWRRVCVFVRPRNAHGTNQR